jgi:toxin ParE1/3/4
VAEYRLTPKAVNDLRGIWHHIASENEPAADALVNRIFDKLELAAGMPLMGSPRPSLSARCRLLVEGNTSFSMSRKTTAFAQSPSFRGCATRTTG